MAPGVPSKRAAESGRREPPPPCTFVKVARFHTVKAALRAVVHHSSGVTSGVSGAEDEARQRDASSTRVTAASVESSRPPGGAACASAATCASTTDWHDPAVVGAGEGWAEGAMEELGDVEAAGGGGEGESNAGRGLSE